MAVGARSGRGRGSGRQGGGLEEEEEEERESIMVPASGERRGSVGGASGERRVGAWAAAGQDARLPRKPRRVRERERQGGWAEVGRERENACERGGCGSRAKRAFRISRRGRKRMRVRERGALAIHI
jgi:hypothetical protein